jgi:hypothetical protein
MPEQNFAKEYRIRDWGKHFENNRTRELKRLDWVPVPNKMDGDGYTDLITRDNGPALFGIWVLMLQLASKCTPRGSLVRESCGPDGQMIQVPHTAETISRITRCPVELVTQTLSACVEIGWVEITPIEASRQNIASGCGKPPTEDGTESQGDASVRVPAREGNGTEANGREASEANALEVLLASKLPETAVAVRESFPDADDGIVREIARASWRVCRDITDAGIAETVRSTRKESQTSPGLWLITVPERLQLVLAGKIAPISRAGPRKPPQTVVDDPYWEVRTQ